MKAYGYNYKLSKYTKKKSTLRSKNGRYTKVAAKLIRMGRKRERQKTVILIKMNRDEI
jgi:hypothetical protein